MSNGLNLPLPRVAPPLDAQFRPAAIANRAFRAAVSRSGRGVPLAVALERGDGSISTVRTEVFASGADGAEQNLPYAERLVKFLLWQRGGWRVIVGGPPEVGQHLQRAYAAGGIRAFDADFMGGVYEHPFTVEVTDADRVPDTREGTTPLGRHLDGCRIGLDVGASDYKVAAVVDGEDVFSEETVWDADPKLQSDPVYHYERFLGAVRRAAEHLPRVDAIGVSSAGVYIDNRVRVASVFRGVPKDAFEAQVADIYLEVGRALGEIPLVAVNDGEVAALAGSMALEANAVLGIALGSSEAGGYVTPEGNITGWLNELAFCPIDYHPEAPLDEWSGDRGAGVQYLSQVGAIRLATAGGLELPDATPAERLVVIQDRHAAGDERARGVFESIGSYLGYAIAHYAGFYDLQHVLILGRVTSREGGPVIEAQAVRVLQEEFPELVGTIKLHLPDETSRRVGQAVAAASLPYVSR